MSETLSTLADFEPLVGQAFVVPFDDGTERVLTLSSASVLPICDYPGRQRDPFDLRFTEKAETYLPQRTYYMVHPSLGNLEVFLVPVAEEGGQYTYQAIYT